MYCESETRVLPYLRHLRCHLFAEFCEFLTHANSLKLFITDRSECAWYQFCLLSNWSLFRPVETYKGSTAGENQQQLYLVVKIQKMNYSFPNILQHLPVIFHVKACRYITARQLLKHTSNPLFFGIKPGLMHVNVSSVVAFQVLVYPILLVNVCGLARHFA